MVTYLYLFIYLCIYIFLYLRLVNSISDFALLMFLPHRIINFCQKYLDFSLNVKLAYFVFSSLQKAHYNEKQ